MVAGGKDEKLRIFIERGENSYQLESMINVGDEVWAAEYHNQFLYISKLNQKQVEVFATVFNPIKSCAKFKTPEVTYKFLVVKDFIVCG